MIGLFSKSAHNRKIILCEAKLLSLIAEVSAWMTCATMMTTTSKSQ